MHAPSLRGVRRLLQRVAATAIACGSLAPVAAAGPVAAGNTFNLVAMPDGSVAAWGVNGSGQLGIGNTQPKAVPTAVPGLTGVVAVSAGFSHSMALTSGGLVYTWGANASKQLGNNSTTASSTPILLSLTGVVAIAAGDYHSVALTNDGNVWVWGSGQYGQTGVNSTANIGTPTQIAALANVTAIAAGSGHTMVRKSDSTVWVFGWNAFGQLAQGNTTNALTPVQVSGVTTATGIAAGSLHSLVLLADGTVKAAGYNQYGQAGDNSTTTPRTSLVTVTGLTSVTAIVGGGSHSGAIRSDGSVRLWGLGSGGQLGTGNPNNALTATAPLAPSTATLLSLGASHTLVVTSTGVVYSFGSNASSELGDGTTQARSTPDTISGTNYTWKVGTPTFNVTAGTYNVEKTVTVTEATPGATIHYTLNGNDPTESDPTVASGGTVLIDQTRTLKARAWNGTMPVSNLASAVYTLAIATPIISPSPTLYTTPQTVTLSTSSPGVTLRYTVDGSTPTAGSPQYAAPFGVSTQTTVKVIGFRTGWTTSIVNFGTYTFNFGTLAAPTPSPGAGSYTSSATVSLTAAAGTTIRYTMGTTTPSDPTTSSPIYTAPLVLTTSQIIKARAFHPDYQQSPVTTAAYTITVAAPTFTPTAGSYAAGTAITIATATPGATIRYTTTGLDPTDTDLVIASGSSIPVGTFTLKAKAMFTGATTSAVSTAAYTQTGSTTTASIEGGGQHAVAVRADGSVFAWGDGASSALGDGFNVDRLNPVLVNGLSGITKVSAGDAHTLYLRSDGKVLGVGVNSGGRLGNGNTTLQAQPVFATGITTATAVSAGGAHSLVLLANGTVMAFGENGSGQLGLGDTSPRSTPTLIPTLSNIVAVSAGTSYSLALTATGTVYAFGANGNGQLGLGDQTTRTSPTLIASLSGVTAIGAGNASSAVLLSTGGVKTFGFNLSGQLGNGSFSPSYSPVSVSGLTDATAIAVGAAHMLARRADATLVAWGSNGAGQLGAGPIIDQTAPVAVTGLTNVTGIGAGGNSSYAWRAGDEAWSFGGNLDGRLGDSTLTNRDTPVIISGPSFAWKVWTPTLSLAAGTYAADQTVTVGCTDPVWAGATTLHFTTTGAVPTGTDATVACGGTVPVSSTLTLRVSGWRTGAPTSEVATAAYILQAPPPALSPGTGTYATAQNVTVTTGTSGVTLRYTLDGSEPTPTSSAYTGPVAVSGTLTLKATVFKTGWTPSASAAASYWITTGTVAAPSLTPTAGTYTEAPMVTIATATSGATIRYTVDGSAPTSTSPRYTVPFFVTATTTVQAKAFVAGSTPSATTSATYAVDAAGAVATPVIAGVGGRFTTRQAVTVTGAAGATLRYTTTGVDPTTSDTVVTSGSSLTIDRSLVLKVRAFQTGLTPSAVRRLDYVITGALSAGQQHSVALKADRTIWTWGAGTGVFPLVGDGALTDRLSPVAIAAAGPAVAIAAGREHTLVLKDTATLVAWGNNAFGAIGDNSTSQRLTPVAVSGLTNVVAMAAGNYHSVAVNASGQVFAWGKNDRGQLGLGDTTNRSVPTLVPGLSGAVAVAAGDSFSLVLTTDGGVEGRLWAFGANNTSQLGDGSTTDRTTPVAVVGLTTVVAMDAGATWAFARASDGRLFAWGANSDGQLASGTTLASTTPAQIVAVSDADLLAAGETFAIATDGRARYWTWGDAGYGETGTGEFEDHLAPSLSPTLHGATAVTAGRLYAIAAKTDGTVWSTGQNMAGALGIGNTSSPAVWTSTSSLQLATQTWLTSDADSDGLNAWKEHLLGTDPLNADTNGNGIPDGVEAHAGQPASNLDPDGDGVPSARETERGTDPYRADTDGDGVLDGADVFPLDPTRSALPPPTPGDTMPPVITLIEPTNAIPIP